MSSTGSAARLSLTNPGVQQCPFDFYETARSKGGLYRDPVTGFYLVLDYDLARHVAMDTATYSSSTGMIQGRTGELGRKMVEIQQEHGIPSAPVLLVTDPPAHRFYRSLVEKAFSPARVKKLEDFLVTTVAELVDDLADRSPIDFVHEMCVMVPVSVLVDLLGVDRSHARQIKIWSDAAAATSDPSLPDDKLLEYTRLVCDFQRFIAENAARYREQPSDCLLSALVHAEVEGRRLNINELVALARQIMVAGHETTTSVMAAGMTYLIDDPALADRLRKEPSLIPAFIDEVLRLESPLQGQFRKAMRDVVLEGTAIPAGAIIDLRYGAANRDSAQFAQADILDLARSDGRQHIAFGVGPHFCIGNQLARAELRIAFTDLLKKLANFRYAAVETPLVRTQHYFIRGIKHLHIAYDRVARS
jgi:cytochrome P450